MGLKDKYQIDNKTWKIVQKKFIYSILLGVPVAAFVFSFCTWPIIDGFSWTLVPIIPWSILYIVALSIYSLFLTRSMYTLFALFLVLALFLYSFTVLASACVFRLFGIIGLFIQSTFLIVTGIFLCRHYYRYYGHVWDSHCYHNENTVLDQKNGRYDFLNNFNMDEYNIKKKSGEKYSNAALTSIIYMVSPIGGGIAIIFSKGHDYTIPIIIGWVLSVLASLGFTKIVAGGFFMYRKLAYFEKKLGKPIINGLLDS